MQIITKPLAELQPAPYNPCVELKPDDPRLRNACDQNKEARR